MSGFRSGKEDEAVKETIVNGKRLPGKKRENRYTEHRESFQLKDGRYAYRDHDPETNRIFYRVVDVEDPVILHILDESDHAEEMQDRYEAEVTDAAWQAYLRREESDEDENHPSPIDRMMYQQWRRNEGEAINNSFPLDPRIVIIECIVQQLPPKERLAYTLLYDRNYSEKEIKEMLGMSDSAWSNIKNRLETDVRNILTGLGYPVPEGKEKGQSKKMRIEKQGRGTQNISRMHNRKKGAKKTA